jgi:hypothetical protein
MRTFYIKLHTEYAEQRFNLMDEGWKVMVTSRNAKTFGGWWSCETWEFIHIVTFFVLQFVYCLLQVNSFCLLFMKELATLKCWYFLMFLFVYVSRGVSSAFGCALFVEGDLWCGWCKEDLSGSKCWMECDYMLGKLSTFFSSNL